MKYFCMVSICFFLFACRLVHVTKQYYNEYVNPVASIDYEDAASADIPAVFLDNYYLVDSRLDKNSVPPENQADLRVTQKRIIREMRGHDDRDPYSDRKSVV